MPDANDRLRAQLDHLLGQYDALRKSLSNAHASMQTVRGRAESDDHLVSATVDAQGKLSALHFDPKVYRKLSPSQLTEVVVDVVRRAGADAAEQLAAVLAPMLPDGAPVADLVSGDMGWDGAEALTGASLEQWWNTMGQQP
jgi:DNA-binding protein YbaB